MAVRTWLLVSLLIATLGLAAAGPAQAAFTCNGCITSFHIRNLGIKTVDLASGSVTGGKIADGTIGYRDIATGAVLAADIATGAVNSAEIADGTVTGTDILNGTITTADLSFNVLTDTDVADRLGRPGFSDTAIDTAGDVGSWASLAIGADGLPVIAYWDATNVRVLAMRCDNPSCTDPGTAVELGTEAAGAYDHGHVSLAIGDDGFPIVAWHDGGFDRLKVVHCTNLTCTTHSSAVVVDQTGSDVGEFSSISVGADGLPLIAYYDADPANLNLKVAHCTTVSCSTSTTVAVDSTNDVGAYAAIDAGADGLPIVAYNDATAGALKFAVCDATCSSATPGTALATNLQHLSLAVRPDHRPIISGRDSASGNVVLVECADTTCTTGTSTTIAAGSAGATSLAIGSENLPFMASNAGATHCANTNCGTAATRAIANAAGLAVAIGVDGLPVIAYYDSASSDLRVLHCANRFCAGRFRDR